MWYQHASMPILWRKCSFLCSSWVRSWFLHTHLRMELCWDTESQNSGNCLCSLLLSMNLLLAWGHTKTRSSHRLSRYSLHPCTGRMKLQRIQYLRILLPKLRMIQQGKLSRRHFLLRNSHCCIANSQDSSYINCILCRCISSMFWS